MIIRSEHISGHQAKLDQLARIMTGPNGRSSPKNSQDRRSFGRSGPYLLFSVSPECRSTIEARGFGRTGPPPDRTGPRQPCYEHDEEADVLFGSVEDVVFILRMDAIDSKEKDMVLRLTRDCDRLLQRRVAPKGSQELGTEGDKVYLAGIRGREIWAGHSNSP